VNCRVLMLVVFGHSFTLKKGTRESSFTLETLPIRKRGVKGTPWRSFMIGLVI
jgi:hypothetical protein